MSAPNIPNPFDFQIPNVPDLQLANLPDLTKVYAIILSSTLVALIVLHWTPGINRLWYRTYTWFALHGTSSYMVKRHKVRFLPAIGPWTYSGAFQFVLFLGFNAVCLVPTKTGTDEVGTRAASLAVINLPTAVHSN